MLVGVEQLELVAFNLVSIEYFILVENRHSTTVFIAGIAKGAGRESTLGETSVAISALAKRVVNRAKGVVISILMHLVVPFEYRVVSSHLEIELLPRKIGRWSGHERVG